MPFQLVACYAGQRIAEATAVPTLREARELAAEIWRRVPLEIVHERTGRLVARYHGRWRRVHDGPIVGVAE